MFSCSRIPRYFTNLILNNYEFLFSASRDERLASAEDAAAKRRKEAGGSAASGGDGTAGTTSRTSSPARSASPSKFMRSDTTKVCEHKIN